MNCTRIESLTSTIQTTIEQQTTISTASPSTTPSRILKIKLFFKGEMLSSEIKDKEKILDLVKEEVSRFLGTVVLTKKRSEISVTEYGAEVILFVSDTDADERRLDKLFTVGIEIEYRGRKMRFTGLVSTKSPTENPAPKEDQGEKKEERGC